MTRRQNHKYRPTESKYKGGAKQMYVTYDLKQDTRGDHSAVYPKVKRVYIAGDVTNWDVGDFQKQSGRTVHGVKIDYEQTRRGYARKAYTATRSNGTTYRVPATKVPKSVSGYSKVVEIPDNARNVCFHQSKLPGKYQQAAQNVR